MKKGVFSLLILTGIPAFAQDKSDSLTISGYGEAYYSYDFNKPSNNTRPGFLYNFNRHNEFNINLAYIKANYASARIRGNIAIGTGSYMNANYAAEHGVLKNIFEANTGYKLSKTKNIWFDIGIMPSHIGFESATGKDNWTLTRSLVAENSPYYESGARLSFTSNNNKLTVAALAVNGWQRITRVDGNSFMSWGTQIYFKPSDRLTLNYSTFVGTDKPDTARVWRYYHNVYIIWSVCHSLGITAGFDIGTEGSNTWCTPVGIIRYTTSEKWSIAYRAEYFKDKDGVIIATGTSNGFETLGNSINIDYLPAKGMLMRLEGRLFNSKNDIFIKEGTLKNKNASITFSTAVYF